MSYTPQTGFPFVDLVLARSNGTTNHDFQADDHNDFAAKITLLKSEQAAFETYVLANLGGVGGLLANAANPVTSQTTLDQVSGVPAFLLRAQPGSATPAGAGLGFVGFGGQYDGVSTHFVNQTAGMGAAARQPYTVAHAGTDLSLYSTPDNSVLKVEGLRLTGPGDVVLPVAASLDADNTLTGGSMRALSALQIHQQAAWPGDGARGTSSAAGVNVASDGVITAGAFTVTCASNPFRDSDVGKYVYVNVVVGTTGIGYGEMDGYIVSVSGGTGPTARGTITLNRPALLSGSSCFVYLEDTFFGTPFNLIIDQTDNGSTSSGHATQAGVGITSNFGPRGLWNIEGHQVINNAHGRPAITMQTMVLHRNAPGVASSWSDFAAGFVFADQFLADGATVNLTGGQMSMFINNVTFAAINGGTFNALPVEYREYQTESGANAIDQGLGSDLILGGRVGFWSAGMGGRRFATGGITGWGATTAGNTTVSTTNAFFLAEMVGRMIDGDGIPDNTVISSVTNSTHAVLSKAPSKTLSGTTFGVYMRTLHRDYAFKINRFNDATDANIGIATHMPIVFTPAAVNDAETHYQDGSGNPIYYSAPFPLGYMGTRASDLQNHDYPNVTNVFVKWANTMNLLQSADATGSTIMFTLVQNLGVFKNDPSVAANLGFLREINLIPTVTADSQAITLNNHRAFRSFPIYNVTGGGTLAVTDLTAFLSGATIGAGVTVALRRGLFVQESGSGGTVTQQIGVDVAAMTFAGAHGDADNIGIRNASSLVQSGNAYFTGVVDFTGASSILGVTGSGLDITSASSPTVNVVTATGGIVGMRRYAGAPNLRLNRANGTTGAGTPVAIADVIGIFSFAGATTTSATPSFYGGASIRAIATENYVSTTNGGTQLLFSVTPNGGQTLTPALTIDQDLSLVLAGALNTVSGLAPKLFDTSTAATNAANVITATSGLTGLRYYGGAANLRLTRANGTTGAGTPAVVGDVLAIFSFAGATSTSATPSSYSGASIRAIATDNYSGSLGGTQLIVSTTPNGGQVLTPALTIGQDQSLTVAGNGIINGGLSVAGATTLGTTTYNAAGNIDLGDNTFDITATSLANAPNLGLQRNEGAVTASGATIANITARGVSAFSGSATFTTAAQITIRNDQGAVWGPSTHGGAIDFKTSSPTTILPALTIDMTQAVLGVSPTGGLGYGTGAGGTVTQATNKSTGVTLNKVTGQITMQAASLAATTNVTFVLTNSTITANDLVVVMHNSAGTTGAYSCWSSNLGAGSCSITVRNTTGGALAEAIVLTFVVIRAVTS